MGTIAEELIAEGIEKGQVQSVVKLAARGVLSVTQARQELESLVREGRITREQADAGIRELPR